MSWEDVSTNAIDIKKHKGEAYEGIFKGHRNIDTKIGKQVIWEFADKDGVPFGIYGFTNLNRAMEALESGVAVRITYKGTENVQTKFGMKDVHQVSVQIWKQGENDKADDLPF